MTMHVSVGIVAYGNTTDIERCLAALTTSSHADFDVVICENGGRAAYDALIAAIPSALQGGQPVRAILANGNLGFAGGVNRCIAEAPGADAWWVLNPDTAPQPKALAAMTALLGTGDYDAVGSTMYFPDGSVQSYGGRWRPWLARAESIGKGRHVDDAVDAAEVERVQSYLNGASMLIGRGFLEAVGPMREDYFLYCEEVEWCVHALAKGMRLGFAPEALVMHEQGTTTGAGDEARRRPKLPVFLNERNKILMTRDRFPARLPIAVPAALAILVLRYGRARAWRQLGYALSGWCQGVMNRRGPPPFLGLVSHGAV